MAVGKLLDYSQARPNLAAVKAAGYSAVYRYVCSDVSEHGLPGKRLTPAERDAILAAGLDIGLHGEDESMAASKGYSRGLEQGKQWADYASGVLHAPQGMTIVAAVDYDTPGQYPAVVDDYLRGVEAGFAGRYRLGVYGDHGVITGAYQAGRGLSCYVMTNAWDIDTPPDFCHLHQHGGSEFPNTDFNDILRVPHGTWLQTLGDDVALDPNDPVVKQILAGLGTIIRGDDPDPPTGDTHPDNIQRTRRDLTAFRNDVTARLTDLQAELDAVKAVVTGLSTGGAVAFELSGTMIPKATP